MRAMTYFCGLPLLGPPTKQAVQNPVQHLLARRRRMPHHVPAQIPQPLHLPELASLCEMMRRSAKKWKWAIQGSNL